MSFPPPPLLASLQHSASKHHSDFCTVHGFVYLSCVYLNDHPWLNNAHKKPLLTKRKPPQSSFETRIIPESLLLFLRKPPTPPPPPPRAPLSLGSHSSHFIFGTCVPPSTCCHSGSAAIVARQCPWSLLRAVCISWRLVLHGALHLFGVCCGCFPGAPLSHASALLRLALLVVSRSFSMATSPCCGPTCSAPPWIFFRLRRRMMTT